MIEHDKELTAELLDTFLDELKRSEYGTGHIQVQVQAGRIVTVKRSVEKMTSIKRILEGEQK